MDYEYVFQMLRDDADKLPPSARAARLAYLVECESRLAIANQRVLAEYTDPMLRASLAKVNAAHEKATKP